MSKKSFTCNKEYVRQLLVGVNHCESTYKLHFVDKRQHHTWKKKKLKIIYYYYFQNETIYIFFITLSSDLRLLFPGFLCDNLACKKP